MDYFIKNFSNTASWKDIPKANISIYPWNCKYQPISYAQLYLIENKSFILKMTCFEKEPKAIYKNHNDMVCKDSCMEFFVNFAPEKSESGYLNFEANSNGTLLLFYGNNRYDRKSIVDMGINPPKVQPYKDKEKWSYTIEIPLKFIKSIYNKDIFKSGDIIKGNFYKCGDETEIPHYGVWANIKNDIPDFHRPEYFGNLIIE